MNRTKRTLSRVAGLTLVLSGAAALVAGQASANDRSVSISCTGQSAGNWEVSVTFSSIEVRDDRPVQVTLGSASTTLTEPTLNGTVTLSQTIGDTNSVSLTWSVVRIDYQNMGVLNLDRPDECRERTTTTPAPPVTEQPPTTPPTEVTVATTPESPTTPGTPAPTVTVLGEVVRAQSLPETGGTTLPLLLLGGGALAGGFVLVAASRRRPETV